MTLAVQETPNATLPRQVLDTVAGIFRLVLVTGVGIVVLCVLSYFPVRLTSVQFATLVFGVAIFIHLLVAPNRSATAAAVTAALAAVAAIVFLDLIILLIAIIFELTQHSLCQIQSMP
jgi:hypothetical protein